MLSRLCVRQASAAAASAGGPMPWLAATDNIAEMNARHEGLWFKVPDDHVSSLGIRNKHMVSPRLYKQMDTFGELYVMARRPLLQLVHYCSQTGPGRPHLRLLLAGEFGTGKRTTLLQTLLYGVQQGYCVVHVPSVLRITRGVTEVATSPYNKMIDTPIEASSLLAMFKNLNQHLHDTFVTLPLTKTYTFTEQDSLKDGEPLMSLIDFGISRGVFATDCVGALFRELKHYANTSQIKLLVTLNEANSLFFSTSIRRSDLYMTPASQLAIVKHLTGLVSDDWVGRVCSAAGITQTLFVQSNGAVVGTLSSSEFRRAQYKGAQTISETPKALLGIEGVHCFDPFLSFSTGNYSVREAQTTMEFFKQKDWILPGGETDTKIFHEIYAISAGNPLLFDEYMATFYS